MKVIVPPLPAGDDAAERVVLRDGSVATLRPSRGDDAPSLKRFFHDLSPESRRRRFFTLAEPGSALIEKLCDSSDPVRALTLLAIRVVDGEARPIAVGSYLAESPTAAEVAFAVDDRFHGKGLGTVLLERLAAAAIAHGFRRFEATTLAENAQMLEVFRESGFEIRSRPESGTIAVRLSLDPTAEAVASEDRRNALATVASIAPMLEPRAVAVVGASRDAASIGRRVFQALRANGYGGPIYPINPNATDLDGMPCYGSVREAPAGIDLAIVTVPRHTVLSVADDCAAAGVKGLLVITAGFAEIGDEGRVLQQQLVEKVRGYGMRMIGPNCMGLMNARRDVRMNASFSPIMPQPGHVALSSQSGALGVAILRLAADRGVGFSTFVSVGNKADVSGNDLLQYWEADAHTSVILLYLESFGNPRRFARLARRIGRRKPIVAIKAGRTHAGSRAVGSHTAALAASDAAVDAMFRQSGVIRADTIDEMFDIAACLDAQPLPRGRRVAIVTNAGGPGILAVDACEAAGLTVPQFSAETGAALAAFLPSEASVANPVDMVASAGPVEFRRAIEIVLAAGDADALIIIYTPVDTASSDATLDAIREAIRGSRQAGATARPIVACLMASSGRPVPLDVGPRGPGGDERVPAYAFPENAARALAKAAAYAEWRAKNQGLFWTFEDIRADDARAICRRALDARGEGWLTGDEVRAVLGAFALPLAPGTIAHSPDEAAALAQVIGFPVVAKLSARAIPHKSDVGAVRVNLTSDQAVRQAFTDIMAVARTIATDDQIEGVLVQSMVTGGIETMIGLADDPLFGPVVAFGLGGIHVEILRDVRFRIAPLTDVDADELLHEIRGLPLLQGYRGHSEADLDALRELLLRVSRLAVEVPEIAELDLNPVIALPPGLGCRVVDARVKVRERP
jgi:acetyl coenzyme A synthetase (ADP forming)-like protein